MNVISELAAIAKMDTPALHTKWRELYQTDPPAVTKAILVARLSYRVQELFHGGMSREAKAKLERLIKKDKPKRYQRAVNKAPVGTKLIRPYKGIDHEVLVTETGFEYQGRPYRSLSAIAREITGTRWNGPKFFDSE